MEEIPATDGSIQKCLIFETIPGVDYRVEVSDDLAEWSTESETYGMGYEFAIPVREAVPPPPPGPGDPPAPIGPPVAFAALRMQRSSGAEGGTVVSWPSLDDGTAVSVFLEAEMHQDWQAIPLFAERYDDHEFFIWHPGNTTAPPAENPPLGAKDAVMFTVLQDHFDDMNLAVANAAALARNTPAPAESLDSKRFWRIRADWSVDTDHDGTPDWSEFETAADPAHPDQELGDPFKADADEDGVNDAEQRDTDKDGLVDQDDVDQDHSEIDWRRGPSPKYALFELAGAPSPMTPEGRAIHVTDTGAVLFQEGVWVGGSYHTLNSQGSIALAKAKGMNSAGQIIGTARADFDEDGNPECPVIVHWPGWNGSPSVVEVSTPAGKVYAQAGYDMLYGLLDAGTLLDAAGNFFALSVPLTWDDPGETQAPRQYQVGAGVNERWTLPATVGSAPSHAVAPPWATNLRDTGTFWGRDYQNGGNTILKTGGAEIAAEAYRPRMVEGPGKRYFAFGNGILDPLSLMNSQWSESEVLKGARDMSDQGWAIMSSTNKPLIWSNGFSLPLAQAAPGLPGNWQVPIVDLGDISSLGNILASCDDDSGTGTVRTHALGVPFYLEDVVKETGVDSVSVTVKNTGPGTGVADKHWIMAPAGGENTVRIRSTACATCPLHLSSAAAGIAPATISADSSQITVSAPAGATSGDHDVTVKLGAVTSRTYPVGIKVMKKRDIRVTVHKIASVTYENGVKRTRQPSHLLTGAQIEEYLEKVYEPQLNTTFIVTMNPPEEHAAHELEWDKGTPEDYGYPDSTLFGPGDGRLQIIPGKALAFEPKLIRDAYWDESSDINVYLVGRANMKLIMDLTGEPFHLKKNLYGIAYVEPLNIVFVDGSPDYLNFTPGFDHAGGLKHTYAHEIGHVFFGEGHPDQGGGPAPLPGTNHQDRLMMGGTGVRYPDYGLLIVKPEWDKAEGWMQEFPDKR